MKKYHFLPVVAIIILVFLLTLFFRMIPAIHSLELKTIDWRFAWRGAVKIDDSPIVLVTIDDQSFESLSARWPWPRAYYAHLIKNLEKAGAKVVGIDVMLDVPDKENPASDMALADAMKNSGNVVLSGKIEERADMGQVSSYQMLVTPAPVFLQADSTWGLVSNLADPDGVNRQYLIVLYHQKELLPSFGLQVIRKYLDIPDNQKPVVSGDSIRLANVSVPLTNEGMMRINFVGPPGTFPQYSFDSVIDDSTFDLGEYDLNYFNESLLPNGVFKDKIVLIGSTVSELHDVFPTPFYEYQDREGKLRKKEMPGVEIHASAIWTILNRAYFTELPFALSIILLLLFIIIIYLVVLRFSTAWAILFFVALLLIYNLGQFFLFSNYRIIMNMVGPTMAMAFSFVASNLHQYILTKREKKMIIGAFERFVPQSVVKELLAHPEKLQLGGEERFLTVVFQDLANFTSVAEKLKPAELVHLINAYLTEMTEVILKHDGIIDKYEGDLIMAEFGAPVFFEDHAVKACFAALEMQERLSKLNLSKYTDVINRLSCRIGINSGHMIVGNMGSKNVFDYTVMGDAVNLASRLEGANKLYKTNIMISEDTYKLVKDVVVSRPLDLIRVKGREKPVRVLEVLARREAKIRENVRTMLPVFVNGVRYYHQRDWQRAEECFEYCLKVVPDDGPSFLYLERVREYKQNPPPEAWDGVFTMQTK